MSQKAINERRLIDLPVDKVRPAYRQIADQMRDLIVTGTLRPGEQLPSEEQLSSKFGVSRNTTREALRILSSQGLVRTTRGVAGGTFVATPDMVVVQDNIENGIGLLNSSKNLSPLEVFETRAILEIPGARMAAERRTHSHLQRIRLAADSVERGQAKLERTNHSMDFHQAVLEAANNRLLSMIAPPVWRAFAHCAQRTGDSQHIWHDIDCDHKNILDCIERQDADAAAHAMQVHLERLRDNNL